MKKIWISAQLWSKKWISLLQVMEENSIWLITLSNKQIIHSTDMLFSTFLWDIISACLTMKNNIKMHLKTNCLPQELNTLKKSVEYSFSWYCGTLNQDSTKISRYKTLHSLTKICLHISTPLIGYWQVDQQLHLFIRCSLIMVNSMLTSKPPLKICSSLVVQKTTSSQLLKMSMLFLGITTSESIFVQPHATISTATRIADGQDNNLFAPSATSL